MEPRTFTVKFIQRPFTKLSDHHTPNMFTRRIDFYSRNDANELRFHWQQIAVQSQDEVAFAKLMEQKMIIELPSAIEIPEGKCLWLVYSSYLYIADAKNPSEKDMQQVCTLANCWDRVPGQRKNDEIQYLDIVVIKHLLTPAEGYPTEVGVLRAMTCVTTTLTEDSENNYHFGPKDFYVRDCEVKWKQWLEDGRIVDLPTPILHRRKDPNINGYVVGEEGFWTDSTREHHFGVVPQESKCLFITHFGTFGKKPAEGHIERRHAEAGYYYIFDVGMTEHFGGDGSMSHQFAADISHIDDTAVVKGTMIKLPEPWRVKKNMGQLWVDSKGNVYIGHGTEPNSNPYVFIMHSPVMESLPMEKQSSDRYVDFAVLT